jgi:signal transduction histidine kinase
VRVREIFVNLLSNALQYSDRSRKRVEVGYIAPGEAHPRPEAPPGAAAHVIFYVRDDGIGIPRKHHGRVFEMFKRLHGREQYGDRPGAGLTIVKKLVERHRGQIWLDSAPGQGTAFYFTLPGEEAHG